MKYFVSWMTTFIICLALASTVGQPIPKGIKALLAVSLIISQIITTICVIMKIRAPGSTNGGALSHMLVVYLQLTMMIEAFAKYL